jgi:hypothetical protein
MCKTHLNALAFVTEGFAARGYWDNTALSEHTHNPMSAAKRAAKFGAVESSWTIQPGATAILKSGATVSSVTLLSGGTVALDGGTISQLSASGRAAEVSALGSCSNQRRHRRHHHH